MSRPCKKPLRTNPFVSYRDPKTGAWSVIKCDRSASVREPESSAQNWLA